MGHVIEIESMTGDLVSISIAVIRALTKSNLGRLKFISSYTLLSNMKNAQCRNSQQELKAETLEECCLLALSKTHIQHPLG